ncbi:MAG: hypothetical protein PUH10_09115 [Erysipelotrichaceae bacterium]|uniref:hypothetical protein n=1 Tax=Floccifex sp. TaxID=2815810 RepID=UPI002A765BE2|nr:hypothetical protein [Floccifex sp.]MDD7282129.1 hypothetical protein [Erysipelotrichaceae bacterium]MDY2958393.1 hypothetical protein [Floccifex sp.]
MFYNNFKNEALEAHNKAVNSYRRIYDSFVKQCEKLYKIRIKACNTIELILTLINSIANKPKEFVTDIEEISIEKQTFHDTEEYQNKANDSLKFSALGTVAGISVGTVVATASSAAYAGPIGLGIGVGATAASVLKLSFDNTLEN